MRFLGLGKSDFVVHYKENGEDKSKSFSTYPDAIRFKQECNNRKLYAYIKKE